ncbi:T9SS type A sorting domain-containing protein [Flammeovirga yaeyamensis]|uniref:T9SS type A sorting domain-containing protein n=1 Tax=Flammeovirga yaeyamensis TaxID=367791 RepID=A0AAX1NBD2_9BACT|nr:M43 family zinc metalloprotease [Flammeovirga yaeyamensis]MBB3697279.1 PKD repeat protein [Flammeovirga yaeyamensis]NMF33936.1 T9SS type A sorting domain-containing protein [Flammeovirga yaeyamensis]QWG04804.1 T9SS type A sorting domain-containing protein [Flammeovirga yaeyamensis]
MTRSIFFLLLLFTTYSFSQTITPKRNSCLTKSINSPYYNDVTHPGDEAFEAKMRLLTSEYNNARIKEDVIQIPVVVHVIHNGTDVGVGANIANAQILSQIRILNEDFRRTENTPGFNDHQAGADTKIEFVMALRDEDENILTEPGVDRVLIEEDFFTADEFQMSVKPHTIWDPTKYLNIWTCTFGGVNSDLLGYAQFPNVPSDVDGLDGLTPIGGMASTDGVVIGYQFFGDTLNVHAPYDKGRTTTHEIGHWLGLIHIWGDGDCDVDDHCDDTPNQDGPNQVCMTRNSCIDPVNDQNDMIENYMDYTPDDCMNIFTQDQKTRMRIVLNNSIRRKELLLSEKHIPLSVPHAHFVADSTSLDVNTYITFTDSTRNSPREWSWFFEGGAPSTSSAQHPRVQYREYGEFDVTLIASNDVGADTLHIANHISVARVTSLEDDLFEVSTYPNPTFHSVKLNFAHPFKNIEVDVFNLKGAHMDHIESDYQELIVDMHQYPKGLYLIKVNLGGNQKVVKVMKQ